MEHIEEQVENMPTTNKTYHFFPERNLDGSDATRKHPYYFPTGFMTLPFALDGV